MTARRNEELEFSVLVNGEDRSIAEVFTDDPIWVERLKRQKWIPYKVTGASHFYKIPVKKIISIRNVKEREPSQAQKEAWERSRRALFARRNPDLSRDLETTAIHGDN